MIEMKIPKELNRYEVKTVGMFTTRQAIALAVSIPLCILSWKLTHQTIICMLIAIPSFLYGWYKPYGMHFEDFLKTAFISNVLAPKHRKYKTENFYESIREEVLKEEMLENNQNKKNKKQKYKKSKSAIK